MILQFRAQIHREKAQIFRPFSLCSNYCGVDGWIILGWISRRWDVGIWTRLGWPRIGKGGGRL